MLEKYFNAEKLKDGVVECLDASDFEVTNEIFIKLGEFKQKYTALTWKSLTSWASEYFKIAKPLEASVSSDFSRLIRERYKLRSNKLARTTMLSQVYVFPVPKIEKCKLEDGNDQKPIPGQNDEQKHSFPAKKSSCQFSGCSFSKILESELTEYYDQMAEMASMIEKLQESLTETTNATEKQEKVLKKEQNSLKYQLDLMTRRYENLKEKMNSIVAKYKPRNVNKRERRKVELIAHQNDKIERLELEQERLEMEQAKLQQSLGVALEKFNKERQKVYHLKRVGKGKAKEDKTKELKDKLNASYEENDKLNEQIDELMTERDVQLFEDGKYKKEVRMVYYDLLGMNVSIDNCHKVVKTVLEKLANIQVDRLPKKSLASMMMVETRILAQMRATEAMLEGERNVLHTDGTKLRFEELSSFQVTTESGSYSLGMDDLLSGSALCFFDSFRNLLSEMAELFIVPQDQKDKLLAMLLSSIKNVMTDRHVVNSSFVNQLSAWRQDILPVAIENYGNLPDEEKVKLVQVNHVFCGLHVVYNLGIAAEGAVKEWVKIAAVVDKHAGFITKNSRIYDMLYEVSKICSSTHGDQRNGKAVAWDDYLFDKKKRKITLYLFYTIDSISILCLEVLFITMLQI